VTFNQSLAGCVAVGTIGSLGFHDTDTALYADFGEPNANSVAVEIWHLAPTRALADNSFHLPPWVSGFCEVRRRGGLAGRFYPGHRVQSAFALCAALAAEPEQKPTGRVPEPKAGTNPR
jgi:hypothetical protein